MNDLHSMAIRHIEYGKLNIGQMATKIALWYIKHGMYRVCSLLVSMVVIALASFVRMPYYNFDSIINGASAFTLDEPTYIPFKLSDDIITHGELVSSETFQIKESAVDWAMQRINLQEATVRVLPYLGAGG